MDRDANIFVYLCSHCTRMGIRVKNMNGHETEVKFYIRDLRKIELRLRELKAQLIQPRIHEINFRYDLPDGSLRAKGQAEVIADILSDQ